jgi:hypothetical protein
MKRKLIISLCTVLIASTAMAQEESGKKGLFHSVKKLAEATMVHGVDTNYIKTPELPWQVSIKSRVAQTDLQMHSTVNGAELFDGGGTMPLIMGVGDMATDPRIMTRVSTSLGVKVGYKGLSLSYSFPVGGDKGQNLSLRTAGRWYSVNLRWHKFKAKNARIHYVGAAKYRWIEDYNEQTDKVYFTDWSEPESWDYSEKEPFASPVKLQTLIFDGCYIFNSKKFSYAAAYTQKTIQVRSAGAPIVGLMGYYSDFKYNDPRNAELIYEMDGIGRLRQYQVSVGGGYAYNFVPAKGWLISGMFMPMVTIMNRTKINTYTSNVKEVAHEHLTDYAVACLEAESAGEEYPEFPELSSDRYTIESAGSNSRNNRIALNFTGRLSVTYNWDRYFINANGQFNNYNFKHQAMRGHLNDWFINASVGVRL